MTLRTTLCVFMASTRLLTSHGEIPRPAACQARLIRQVCVHQDWHLIAEALGPPDRALQAPLGLELKATHLRELIWHYNTDERGRASGANPCSVARIRPSLSNEHRIRPPVNFLPATYSRGIPRKNNRCFNAYSASPRVHKISSIPSLSELHLTHYRTVCLVSDLAALTMNSAARSPVTADFTSPPT